MTKLRQSTYSPTLLLGPSVKSARVTPELKSGSSGSDQRSLVAADQSEHQHQQSNPVEAKAPGPSPELEVEGVS